MSNITKRSGYTSYSNWQTSNGIQSAAASNQHAQHVAAHKQALQSYQGLSVANPSNHVTISNGSGSSGGAGNIYYNNGSGGAGWLTATHVNPLWIPYPVDKNGVSGYELLFERQRNQDFIEQYALSNLLIKRWTHEFHTN